MRRITALEIAPFSPTRLVTCLTTRCAADLHESLGVFRTQTDLYHFQQAHEDPVDEEHVQDAHREAYQGDASNLSAGSMGSAAALQVCTPPQVCFT